MNEENKSSAIRKAIAEHPQAGPTEIAKIVSDSGLAVTPQFVSTIRKSDRLKSTCAFSRWYYVDAIDRKWHVICSSEGIQPLAVGPVQVSGKSYYQKALEIKQRKNIQILKIRTDLRKIGMKDPDVFVNNHGKDLNELIEYYSTEFPEIALHTLANQIRSELAIPEEFTDYMIQAVSQAILEKEKEPEPVPEKKRPVKKLPNEGVNALIVTHNGTYYCFDMDEETWKKVLSCGEQIESVISRLEQLGEQGDGKKSMFGYVSKIDSANFALPVQNIKPPLNLIDLRDCYPRE